MNKYSCVACRQLSRHLVGLWTAENPVAMNLLKRILVRLHTDLMIFLSFCKNLSLGLNSNQWHVWQSVSLRHFIFDPLLVPLVDSFFLLLFLTFFFLTFLSFVYSPLQPTGLLAYLDSSDPVPEKDVDRMHIRDNLKIASVTLDLYFDWITMNNNYSVYQINIISYFLCAGPVWTHKGARVAANSR